MFLEYVIVEGITVLIGGGLLLYLLRQFTKRSYLVFIVLFPLIAFALGFSLRLSGIPKIIDIGFFFTDFGFLFVYLLFALAFLLGQIKYWKK